MRSLAWEACGTVPFQSYLLGNEVLSNLLVNFSRRACQIIMKHLDNAEIYRNALNSSIHSVVRVDGTISEAFSISPGVRQGCVLAANLFNTATDRILNNTTQPLTLGVNYDDSGQLITDLAYADDVVIFANLLDTLTDALYIFNEQSQKLGLHINWSKTKLQSFSPWMPTPTPSLIGTQPVTTTDNFTYLDSTNASNNSSFNDVNRHIAIATSTMSKLSSIWT